MPIADWLSIQVEAKNFGAILGRIESDNSLQPICGDVAAAVYDEIADPDCDRDFCLSILQAMEAKGWKWNCT